MAADDEQTPAAPMPCAPCRGTGQLISNLGGEPSQVTCPWCEGGGVQLPGHDAQAQRRATAAA
jgi:DnaJ-class molecular chaperone